MITVTILFFGGLKHFFGSSITLDVEHNTSLQQLILLLVKENNEIKTQLEQCKIAVDAEMQTLQFIITKPCEIALLPPFSGG